jgi:hypothetical protein
VLGGPDEFQAVVMNCPGWVVTNAAFGAVRVNWLVGRASMMNCLSKPATTPETTS